MSEFKIGQKVWWYNYVWDEINTGKIIREEDLHFDIQTKYGIDFVKGKSLFASQKEALNFYNEYLQSQINSLQKTIDANNKKIKRLK